MPDTALDDLRIIELAEGVAGPYCGKLFADLGADVIKVEPPGGDRARRAGPFRDGVPNPEGSGLFLYLNTNKRGVTADLATAEGREAVLGLLAGVDVLVTDMYEDGLLGIGLDYADLRERFPALVFTSLTPFGRGGPHGSYRGNAFTVYHSSGLGWETPAQQVRDPANQPPLAPGNPQADYFTGATGAAATMGALFQRESTGRGQLVDISGQEANANHVRLTISGVVHTPDLVPPRTKANFDFLVPCSDGYVFLTPYNLDHWWERFQQIMGSPEWAASEAFLTAEDRGLNCDAIEPLVHMWSVQHTRAELYQMALDIGIPCFPVYSPAEMMESAQFIDRGFLESVEDSEAGSYVRPGPAALFERTPYSQDGRAPRLGEHNEELLERPAEESSAVPAGDRRPAHRRAAGNLPLSGVRVTDFGWILSVPHSTAWLGALGAEVIRVESEQRLDLLRTMGLTRGSGGIPGIERSGNFNGLNYSKRGVTLNIQTERGKELAKELVSRSDIVTMNFAAGVAERLGLGYEDMRAVNPDVIMMSGSPLGQTGPESHSTGWGPTTLAYTTLPYVTGYPGGTPSSMGGAYPDFAIGVHMAFAMMSALRYRDRTGHGQHIDVAMGETVVSMTPEPLLEWTMLGVDPRPRGNRDPDRAPQGVYPAAGEDRWIAISVEDDAMWAGLRSAVGDPAWARDPTLDTHEGRRVRHDDIDRELSAWTSERTSHEAAHLLQAVGVAAVPVLDGPELVDDPQLRHRGFFVDIDHPEVGVKASAGIPLRFGETRLHYGSAPLLGEHNREVFTDLVGIEPEEFERLVRDSVIV
ncbi:MAG: CoA transferase [Chloroflexi bacterium]|nr:CoA transferase [Chloroflexota bacterium]